MIAVTGLMRSGTSPLAMFLHQMGVSMGTHMRFPVQNESAHFEWEDAVLADALVWELLHGKDKDKPRRIINDYVQIRHRSSRGHKWGVKTPFLLPYVEHLREACEEAGEGFVLAVTERKFEDTIVSLRRQMDHLSEFDRGGIGPRVFGLQHGLAVHWPDASKGAEVFHLSDTLDHPRMVAERLAKLAGVEADYDVAIRGFRGRSL